MTPIQAIYARMPVKPKSTLLVGNRSADDFTKTYFSDADSLYIDHLTSEKAEEMIYFSSLAPRGDRRVVVVNNLCHSRKDIQATLLKAIEDSPERSFWVLSVKNRNRILEPIISRSFIMDWVQSSAENALFTSELKQLISSKNYLDLFKLHFKISEMAGKDLEQIKNLHLSCLAELMFLVPTETAKKIQHLRQEIIAQNRTEVSFKSALLEVLS